MATHDLLTPTIIAKEALRLLTNNLVMGNLVYRAYEKEFPGTPKKGGTVTIRKPVKFSVTKARARSTSTITEASITLTVATQAHVSWNFFTDDLTLTIEEYSARYIRPAAAALANQVDADLCGLYADVPNLVEESTAGVTPHTFVILGNAMQKMDEEAAPPDDRVVVFNPAAHWAFANALSNWNFKEGGEQALRKGFLGRIANAEIYMDQNIKVHTTGQYVTAAATEARIAIASTLDSATDGGLPSGLGVGVSQNREILIEGFDQASTVDALVAGDTFTIANVYAVNPMSGESTGTVRRFVVTTAVNNSTVSTNQPALVPFYPDMIDTGPYRTIDTLPVAEALVTVQGGTTEPYPQNLAFHKNAFALVMVPLIPPDGAWASTASEDGCSCRVVKDYNIETDQEIIRLDILYGVKTIYPELACRIQGAEG